MALTMQTYTPVPGMGGNPQQSPGNGYGQNQAYPGAPSLPPQPQPIQQNQQQQQQQQQMGMGMPQGNGMSQAAVGRSSSMVIPSTQPMALLDNCKPYSDCILLER
jgi:hypothetical protein